MNCSTCSFPRRRSTRCPASTCPSFWSSHGRAALSAWSPSSAAPARVSAYSGSRRRPGTGPSGRDARLGQFLTGDSIALLHVTKFSTFSLYLTTFYVCNSVISHTVTLERNPPELFKKWGQKYRRKDGVGRGYYSSRPNGVRDFLGDRFPTSCQIGKYCLYMTS